MNCRRATELKVRYLCGELDRAEASEFELHLLECRECAEMISEEHGIDECVRRAILSEAPETAAVERRVRAAIRRETLLRPIIAGALAAVLVLFFVLGRTFGLAWQSARLCDDAAGDHFAEIVRQDPRHWRLAPTEIRSLAIQQGINPSLLGTLAPVDYHLERAKLCRLDGHVFLHAVYRSERNSVSVYLRASSSPKLPGRLTNVLNGRSVFEAERKGEYIASVGAAGVTAIIVSNSSEQTAISFARFAAVAI